MNIKFNIDSAIITYQLQIIFLVSIYARSARSMQESFDLALADYSASSVTQFSMNISIHFIGWKEAI